MAWKASVFVFKHGLSYIMVWLVILHCAGAIVVFVCDPGACHRGQHCDPVTDQCVKCPADTYLEQDNHTCINCSPCSKAKKHHHQVELEPCTGDHDTRLGCETGYYVIPRHPSHGLDCYPCSSCGPGQRNVSECRNDTDTACTSDDDQENPKEHMGEMKTALKVVGIILAVCMPILILFGIIHLGRRYGARNTTNLKCDNVVYRKTPTGDEPEEIELYTELL